MVRHLEHDGAIGLELISPRALVFELAVQGLPALALFFRVEQRELRARNDRDVGAVRDLEQTQNVLRLFLHPLIAADGGNPKHVELLRLQKHEDGLLIAGAGPARILVDDDFDFLGGGGEGENKD